MKEKRDCKIIQDLLPNYIERLTNEETNHFIEEHLKECTECQHIFENMQKELKVNTTKRDEREVKYMKKFSSKMKLLKFIILTLTVIYVIIVGRRTFIMTSLSEKAKEHQSYNNYYAKLYSYQGNSLTITESYNKGKDYLTTMTRFVNNNQIQKIIYYKKGNEQITLTESNGKRYIQDSKEILGGNISPVTYVSDGLLSNMQYAFIIGIDKTYCNGKQCYIIKGYR